MIRQGPSSRFPSGWLLLALAVVTLTPALSSCAAVAETAIGIVAEEVADGDRSSLGGLEAPDEDAVAAPSSFGRAGLRERERHASVYVQGPTPGWERGPLVTTSAAGCPYFTARLFRGQCPALINLHMGGDRDPFGPLEGAPRDPFSMGNNLGISPDYTPFGRVELGGTGPQYYQWQPMTLFALTGDGCGIAGIRLISFGKDEGVPILHR